MAKKKDKNKNLNQIKNSFKTSLNTDSQTAQITALGRVISDHPSNKITPQKLKSILEDAENGDITAQHELFADIEERDGAIAANIQTRKLAVTTLDWRIAAPRNADKKEQEWQEEIDEFFYQFTGLEALIIDLMDAVGHGFSALEIEWQPRNGKLIPVEFRHKPQEWFTLDKHDNILLRTLNNNEGEELWKYKWIIHKHKSNSRQLARSGLYRTLTWFYMFKHYSVHDFAEFLELYGMPIRIGKYGSGATNEEKRTLLRALAEIGHNAAGIMPESMQIELHNIANGTSANNPFLQMIDWCEKSIAKIILGQTLTSGADGKSSTNALGRVHNEVRRDLLIADAKMIGQTITQQIILPYLQVNVDPNIDPTRIPYFEFDTKEREDLTQFAEALPKLVGIGLQIPANWAKEKLGIPDVQDGEDVLKINSLQPVSEAEAMSEKAVNNRFVDTTQDKEQQILDDELENAFNNIDFNTQLNSAVKQAVSVLNACNSYEEAFEKIAEIYPNLDTATHQKYLTQAIFLSELLGVSNAK
ncbi:hypothetical protein CEP49_06725 [Mergibacter septicus]|uniref:DUF935 domain-containing protein n=1 Tax=Mergibacter septicus TaxID=221402 RepID=UPI00117971C2|nr:DUF935 family protein [Mergibacter septicus]AWX14264.1 hypothetical protein CEP49_06725 [Mergibacter septicus]